MKNIGKIITAALGVVCLASCGNNISETNEKEFPGSGYTECDYIAIKDLNKHIFLGEKAQIDLDSMPEKYKSSVVFISTDESVCTVSATGEINAVSAGVAQVSVKHSDGSLIGKVNVIVTPKDDTNVNQTLSYIGGEYSKASYQAPTKVHKVEYSYENYIKNGKLDHGYTSFEEIYFDKDAAYFMVSGDDINTYTADGARSLGTGKWIFQVQGMKTRMIHITEVAKNYFDFNSASYVDDFQVIYDLLDMFFVSGKDIVTDMLDEYSGKTDFEWYSKHYGEEGIEIYADGKNNMAMNLSFEEKDKEVDTDSELNYVDIFAGTKYNEVDKINYIYEGASCVGFSINAIYNYKEGEVSCQRDFLRCQSYDLDYTPEVYDANDEDMKLAGWAKVDNMYDL